MRKLNFLIRIAVCFLFVFLPLNTLDQWFYDHFFRLRGTQHHASPFLLVKVDDTQLYQQYLQRHPPGEPGEHASLIDAEPRSLWFDAFYQSLLEKLEDGEPKLIVFTSYYEQIESRGMRVQPYTNLVFSATLNRENKLIPPPKSLTAGDNYGFGNLFPDPDNIVRLSHLESSSAPSLALTTYHRLKKEPIERNLPDPLWIDYRGPAGSYPNFDAEDILHGTVPAAAFRGRVILIGRLTSGSAKASRYDTPFGPMSALEIEANTIDTFVTHRAIRICPRWVSLLVAGMAVIASILIILFFPLTLAWLFLLLLSLVIVLVALFLFAEFKIWIGVANAIFCIFGTHLVMLGYKLGRQEEQQWKIQQEAEYLKELDQFKNNFISLFSHDLKTPIAKIRAVTERMLADGTALTPEGLEALRSINRTNDELSRSISDILKVTKMESVSIEPAREVVDLNRLVEIAVQRLRFLADEKRIQIVLDLEPLFSMEGDAQLLQEVITNLVENAIKYSGSDCRVVVRTREEDRFVRVAIIDEGQGIPPDELPRVTGKFYRGRAVSEKVKGSGLGLYLAKYFVELHQGRLEIRSELGRGTEVSFFLPLSG